MLRVSRYPSLSGRVHREHDTALCNNPYSPKIMIPSWRLTSGHSQRNQIHCDGTEISKQRSEHICNERGVHRTAWYLTCRQNPACEATSVYAEDGTGGPRDDRQSRKSRRCSRQCTQRVDGEKKPWVDVERKTTLHQHKIQAWKDQRMLHTKHNLGKVKREDIPLK